MFLKLVSLLLLFMCGINLLNYFFQHPIVEKKIFLIISQVELICHLSAILFSLNEKLENNFFSW